MSWAVGAAIRVIVIALSVLIGAGVLQPSEGGVLGCEALHGLHMEFWAAAITVHQGVLLGLTSHLAASRPVARAAAQGVRPRPL